MNEFTFIDLFAGIGGFHIACSKQGGECVFVSEWDEKCRDTYKLNFSNTTHKIFCEDFVKDLFKGDITKVEPKSIPDHDILCAGFPCQPFSQAGFKKGFEDTRGTLFFNIAEIIKIKKPKAVLLENVRGLLNHDEGRTFEIISNVINELGYDFYFKVIKATEFNCPQHRPRLYMVGIRKDINKKFHFPEAIPLTKKMSDIFDGAEVNREIGYTLRVGGKGSPINDRRNWDGYIVDGKVVRLKPAQALRMQGFPEGFKFNVSENEAMKQLGNSIAIPVVEAIIKNILVTIHES